MVAVVISATEQLLNGEAWLLRSYGCTCKTEHVFCAWWWLLQVSVNDPERNYHVFYQLTAGASAAERSRWHLNQPPHSFYYLNRSTCFELDGVNNAKEYQHTRAAMSHIGTDTHKQTRARAMCP